MSVTECEKVLPQTEAASLFPQPRYLFHSPAGEGRLLILKGSCVALEYLDRVSSSSSLCHAWDFNPSQSLLVAEVAQTRENFCELAVVIHSPEVFFFFFLSFSKRGIDAPSVTCSAGALGVSKRGYTEALFESTARGGQEEGGQCLCVHEPCVHSCALPSSNTLTTSTVTLTHTADALPRLSLAALHARTQREREIAWNLHLSLPALHYKLHRSCSVQRLLFPQPHPLFATSSRRMFPWQRSRTDGARTETKRGQCNVCGNQNKCDRVWPLARYCAKCRKCYQ